jgi:RHS repeat-associated protein
LTDDLGSVRTAITNQAGAATVVGYMGYGPFGFVQYHAGQTGTNKGYTGQDTDPLSGLDYYVARYYDPVVGLFLSADTVQSNLKGFDPYAYVGENPETVTDPTGRDPGWYGTLATLGILAGATIAAVGITALAVAAVVTAPAWVPVAATIAVGVGVGVASAGIESFFSYTYSHGDNVWNDPRAFDDWGKQALVAEGIGGLFGGLSAGIGSFAVPANPLLSSAWGTLAGGIGGIIGTGAGDLIFPNAHPSPINMRSRSTLVSSAGTSGSGSPALAAPSTPPTSSPSQSSPEPVPPVVSPRPAPSQPTSSSSSSNRGPLYYTVASGDSLWAIAARFFGSGLEWQRIYQENVGVIGGNPNLIFPGERLTIH